MKITDEQCTAIQKAVAKTTKTYLKYKVESESVIALVEPLLRKARTIKDIEQLLNVTSPIVAGKYVSADYIGRFDIYYKGTIIRKREKKRKRKLNAKKKLK